MAWPADPLPIKIEIAPGADLNGSPSSWPWVDITGYWRVGTPITITEGRGGWGDHTDPGTCRLILDNQDGRFSQHNPLGEWYGLLGRDTPIRITLDLPDGPVALWGGYVPAWVPSWDKSGADRYVEVTAHGILYRLQPAAGRLPALSPLRRTIAASRPLAYWPVEDGVLAGQAASALPNHPAAVISGDVTFRAPDDLDFPTWSVRHGTAAIADLSQGGRLRAQVPAEVTSATDGMWTVCVATEPPWNVDAVILEVATVGGTYERWQLWLRAMPQLTTQLVAIRPDGTEVVVGQTSGGPGGFSLIGLSAWQAGGMIHVGVQRGDSWYITKSIAGTLGGVAAVATNPTGATVSGYPWPTGHIAVWATDERPFPHTAIDQDGRSSAGALLSFYNEAAHSRIRRLCAEAGIAVDVPPLARDEITAMGWQPVDTLPELLRQAVQADGGILYEQPHQLAYIPRARLYNQAPALVLDWSEGDLASPPQPDSYARTHRNRVEVRRVEGSSAVAELIDDSGVTRDESIELALATDNVLPAHAWWRLHLASYQGLLWPRVELDLAARPEYLAPWLQCHIGSRVKIINAPTDVADQDIDLMIDGWTITLGWRELRVEMTCSPYGPWLVGEIDGEARVAPDVSWLGADLGPDDPEMVLVTPGIPWTTDAADFPLVLRVGGERVVVSQISGTISGQTATIAQRSLSRTWPAGTPVTVWHPAVVAL